MATPDGEIAEGLFGLPEPVGELLGPIAVNDVDVLVIPAAAVSPDGTRLRRDLCGRTLTYSPEKGMEIWTNEQP